MVTNILYSYNGTNNSVLISKDRYNISYIQCNRRLKC